MNVDITDRELYTIRRRKKGITITEIAKGIKVSVSLLSKYEKNHCDMSIEKVRNYKKYIDERRWRCGRI